MRFEQALDDLTFNCMDALKRKNQSHVDSVLDTCIVKQILTTIIRNNLL